MVDVRLQHLEQLYETLDPSPFRERDLDAAAAAYIRESVQELPHSASVGLRIIMPTPLGAPIQEQVREAIRNYFAYRARVNRLRLKRELAKGRRSLLVGLSFLLVCLLLRSLLTQTPLGAFLQEGLLIVGWVAMWRPLEIFLYDWWPYMGRARLNDRLSGIAIEFVSEAG